MTIKGEIQIIGESAIVDSQYLVLLKDLNGAKSGDVVEIENISNNSNILIYKVISIIDETIKTINNIIEGFIILDKKSNGYINIVGKKSQIFVDKNNTLGAKTGDKVLAILGNIGGKPQALVKKIIQTYLDTNLINENFIEKQKYGVEIFNIVASNGIRLEFPEEVLKEVNNLDSNIELEIERRRDLRNLFTITIDGPDSKDLDDAISVELLSNGKTKLYTHIADVTHFVKENLTMDIEAKKRGNSYYFADWVVPMYHEKLSNDLCSLNLNTDKLVITAEIILDKNGNYIFEESSYYESVINTNYRMTYEEIDNIKDQELKLGDELIFGGKVTKDLINLTRNSFNLSEKIGKFLKNNGELNINSNETKIIVDEKKNPIGIKAYPKFDSNDLIKNMMVIVNNVIPQMVERDMKELGFNDFPFVSRIHGTPDERAVEKLENILKVLGIEYDFELDSSKGFSKLLDLISTHPKEKFLTKKITITLQKAIYSAIREGHFGLALEYYSHFTSPIRRYSDTQIHRIMKEIINGTFTKERFEHYMKILPEVAEQCSVMEDVAEKNEIEVNKYLSFELMKDKIGEKFSAYIDDIGTKKVKIILDNTISGVLSPEYMNKYYFDKLFDGVYEMKNLGDDSVIELGDKIEVELENLDELNRELNFKIITK